MQGLSVLKVYVLAQDWQSGREHPDEGDGHRADDCAGVPAAPGRPMGAGGLDRLPPAAEGRRQLHAPPPEKGVPPTAALRGSIVSRCLVTPGTPSFPKEDGLLKCRVLCSALHTGMLNSPSESARVQE